MSDQDRIRKRIELLVGVLRGKIYSARRPVDELLVAGPVDRINYKEAQKLKYRKAELGEQFGPLWSTFWFRGKAKLPAEWANKRADLIWVSHYCESTLWLNGSVSQGLNFSFGERSTAPLALKSKADETVDFQIEMACNTTFGAWPSDKPYDHLSPYVLDKCELGLFDPFAWTIFVDFLVLEQLETDLATTGNKESFQGHLLSELNRFADNYCADDAKTWKPSHAILQTLLQNRNPSCTHKIAAVGEGHLDMAWWWPLAETWRKFIRTTANQLSLMDSYPDYRFVCTQAALYNHLKEQMPDLFERLKGKVKNKQWTPVGGSWVESDCNLPTGESLVRQMLHGQRFFKNEFGFRASECWLQDSFGFNGQLPQLMQLAGMNNFVSQKFHWGHLQTEHQLFRWQGIDGTQVLAHFPSNSTFSTDLSVGKITKAARDYRDGVYANHSLLSFGLGDGGGGPTAQMIEIISRLADLQGAPHILMRQPTEFFKHVQGDIDLKPPVTITGELYFPRHRGTYTTQAKTKKAMRQAEHMLHDVECICAIAFKLTGFEYAQEEINKLWKIVLLNQHHDIFTGTSIAEVHQQAVQELLSVIEISKQLRARALEAISASKSQSNKSKKEISVNTIKTSRKNTIATSTESRDALVCFNTTGFDRKEVSQMPSGDIALIEAPAYGLGKCISRGSAQVQITETTKSICIENQNLLATLSKDGELLGLFDKTCDREALSSPGNRLQLFEDHPLDYDAWELEPFHQKTVRDCPPAHSHKVREENLRGEIIFERKIGLKSTMKQAVRLDAFSNRLEFHCTVNWSEEHKILKVLFPVNVQNTYATYEMQFGAIERPTHYNTAQDAARFEVVAHKWADLSEHGFGVALLSDCKYGFSIYGNEMRLSLLRAPKSPDPNADIGEHEFAYAIMPHRGSWQEGNVVAEGFKFNFPVVWSKSQASELKSFAHIDDRNLVIDTIKKAEDSDALIVRIYEAHGSRGNATLKLDFPVKQVRKANILEDPSDGLPAIEGQIQIAYRPFEIITILVM